MNVLHTYKQIGTDSVTQTMKVMFAYVKVKTNTI